MWFDVIQIRFAAQQSVVCPESHTAPAVGAGVVCWLMEVQS
jgi:hypothetical protein